jgi:adenosylcobinamide-GDP ribazoletransferase
VVVCLGVASASAALAFGDDAWLAGLVAGATGRAAILPLARELPYARDGAGQGRALEGIGWTGVLVGLGLAGILAVAGGLAGVVALGAATVTAAALALFFRAWLGGVTGDTLGATAKLCETAALVGFLAAL